MKAAGRLVIAGLELAAGMQHREDHLEGALLGRWMLVDRNATAVIRNRDGAAIGVKGHVDVCLLYTSDAADD